jgi:hypothetical protein
MREDGLYAAVHIADDADVQTIAGQLRITQLRVLAETITRRRRMRRKASIRSDAEGAELVISSTARRALWRA